jgi:hypothetical protein
VSLRISKLIIDFKSSNTKHTLRLLNWLDRLFPLRSPLLWESQLMSSPQLNYMLKLDRYTLNSRRRSIVPFHKTYTQFSTVELHDIRSIQPLPTTECCKTTHKHSNVLNDISSSLEIAHSATSFVVTRIESSTA